MKLITVIHGPNLNLLGTRETNHYGTKTLDAINKDVQRAFAKRATLRFFQSNHEGAIIDSIHNAHDSQGIVINPGAYTHTSYAIRDALTAVNRPTIEVHISNVHAREAFRRHSVISEICVGVIVGLGAYGYHAAVEALLLRASELAPH